MEILCAHSQFSFRFSRKKKCIESLYDEWKLLKQTYKPYSFWVTRLVGKCILSKVTFGWLNFTHCYVVCALSAAILFLVFCSFSWILSFAVRSTTWISYLLRMFYHWFALNYYIHNTRMLNSFLLTCHTGILSGYTVPQNLYKSDTLVTILDADYLFFLFFF
jgi:hypothetical protein